MDQISVSTSQVLVLAEAGSSGGVSNRRGHLFEEFVARLLEVLGYEQATTSNLNVKSEGIELDIAATSVVTQQALIAECKAYTANVSAAQLNSFIGKYAVRQMADQQLSGLFVALPRLTAEGLEVASAARAAYPNFRYIGSDAIVELMEKSDLLPAEAAGPKLKSDLSIAITEHGLFLAARQLDAVSRRATQVAVWGKTPVPDPVLDLIAGSVLADGLPVVRHQLGEQLVTPAAAATSPTIFAVKGSGSDFEYQLPAAPKYFVGRKAVVDDLVTQAAGATTGTTFVINAKSGWGKSSLALLLAEKTTKSGGVALVVDARTAERSDFIAAVLERVASAAAGKRLLTLPGDAAFSSVQSALSTLERSSWSGTRRPILVVFDQFENVFRDEALTRAFRDLALSTQELSVPLSVGFAWKTDFVGWPESFPYQLRDQIRDTAHVTSLDPLGPAEIGTLLNRLEKAADQKLDKELRRRLREYSQGLPWLIKKLGGHIIAELKRGVSQEHLIREALNVQALFERDLAELSPSEEEALRRIARLAPVVVSDIEETVPSPILQSLLHKRLVVQVGERIDTYWDTFRDFLVTGQVAVEDSYIVRLGPGHVGRLLREVIDAGGVLTVADAATALDTSTNVIFNLSRELRQFGLVTAEANRISVDSEILDADDVEAVIRDRLAGALRRHKIISVVNELTGVGAAPVSLARLASELPAAFPSVDANAKSWSIYARSFCLWLDLAGLFQYGKDGIGRVEEDHEAKGELLSRPARHHLRRVFPQTRGAAAEKWLLHLSDPGQFAKPTDKRSQQAISDLVLIGAVAVDHRGNVTLADPALVTAGVVDPIRIETYASAMPGIADAFDLLRQTPWSGQKSIGEGLASAVGASWQASTASRAGSHVRSWARLCGIETKIRAPASPPRA